MANLRGLLRDLRNESRTWVLDRTRSVEGYARRRSDLPVSGIVHVVATDLEGGANSWTIRIEKGVVLSSPGLQGRPTVVIQGTMDALYGAATGAVSTQALTTEGALRVEGDQAFAQQLPSFFPLVQIAP